MASFLNVPNLVRGLRNNNPGNIRKNSANNWQGKIKNGTDSEFEQFVDLKWGIRALIVLLRNYANQGNNTVSKIINKYAPSTENHTESYIQSVCNDMRVNRMDVLNLSDKSTVLMLVKAIVKVECSPNHNLVTDDELNDGYNAINETITVNDSDVNSTQVEEKKNSFLNVLLVGVVLLVSYFLIIKK